MDLAWEVIIVLLAIILIVVLFKFGMALKKRDLEHIDKYFTPRN